MLRISVQPGEGPAVRDVAGVVPQVVEQDDPASAAGEARERIVQALRPELAREIQATVCRSSVPATFNDQIAPLGSPPQIGQRTHHRLTQGLQVGSPATAERLKTSHSSR